MPKNNLKDIRTQHLTRDEALSQSARNVGDL